MTVTCGGFGNVSGVVNYNKSSTVQNNQTKAEAAQAGSGGVGKAAEHYPTSEYFNDYEDNAVIGNYNHVEGKGNKCTMPAVSAHIEGQQNTVATTGAAVHVEGSGNTATMAQAGTFVGGSGNTIQPTTTASLIHGESNVVRNVQDSIITGNGNTALNATSSDIGGQGNNISFVARSSIINGSDNTVKECYESLVLGINNIISQISDTVVVGSGNKGTGNNGIAARNSAVFGMDNIISAVYAMVFMFGLGLKVQTYTPNEVKESGSILGGAAVIGYIIGEGLTDAANTGNKDEEE